MHQSLGIEVVLSNVATYVDLVFTQVSDLAEHVGTIVFPADLVGKLDSNLAQNCIGVIC